MRRPKESLRDPAEEAKAARRRDALQAEVDDLLADGGTAADTARFIRRAIRAWEEEDEETSVH